MFDINNIFHGILTASPILLFATLFLVILICVKKRKRTQKSYPKYELEIIEKEDGYNVSKYKARYGDYGEGLIEFEVMEKSSVTKPYEVGERFWGHVSPDGKSVIDEVALQGSDAFLYIVMCGLYVLGIYILISCGFPVLGNYFSQVQMILFPLQIIAFIPVIIGLKWLFDMVRFAIRRKTNYYREIPATVNDFKVTRRKTSSSSDYHPVYYPIYIYELDGKSRKFYSDYGKRFPKVEIGDKVILYQDPATSEIVEDAKRRAGMAFGFIGLGSVMFLIFMFVLVISST